MALDPAAVTDPIPATSPEIALAAVDLETMAARRRGRLIAFSICLVAAVVVLDRVVGRPVGLARRPAVLWLAARPLNFYAIDLRAGIRLKVVVRVAEVDPIVRARVI